VTTRLRASALALALACGRPSAPDGAPRLTVVNRTGAVIDAIYLSPHDAPAWEENVLAKDKLADGASVAIRFGGPDAPARWDLRADGGGRRFHAEWTSLDVRAIATITLRMHDRDAVAELTPVAAARAAAAGAAAPILLFEGAGTSPNDVAAVTSILREHHLAYATVSSAQLNAMDESRLRAHRLLIVPGGSFVDIGNGLTPAATASVRSAVRNGLSYLGICAGAFFAGDSPYNGLNLTSGVRFGFYAAEARGIRKAAVPIARPSAPTLDQYWEDGPQLAGWGATVATYPDGTPAIVEGTFGRGWVVLTGVHAEAPASWRRGLAFDTPASVDNAYAATLVRAALDRVPLSPSGVGRRAVP